MCELGFTNNILEGKLVSKTSSLPRLNNGEHSMRLIFALNPVLYCCQICIQLGVVTNNSNV